MEFHYLPQRSAPVKQYGVAQQLANSLHGQQFTSPAHLMETLREHSAQHALDLRVHQVQGTILVQHTTGIILRITPIA